MRHRNRQVGRPSIPCYQKRINEWCRRLNAIQRDIQAEYDSLCVNPPAEPATTIFYAGDLTAAQQFIERCKERLAEYVEIRERNDVWEEAQNRKSQRTLKITNRNEKVSDLFGG